MRFTVLVVVPPVVAVVLVFCAIAVDRHTAAIAAIAVFFMAPALVSA